MTTAKNNIVRSVRPGSVFESAKSVISSATNYNQGDLIFLDTTAHLIKPVTGSGDSATFIGVANQTLINGQIKSPTIGTAVDASVAISDVKGPSFGVVVALTLKTGDAFNPGQLVYIGTNAQEITSVAAGTAIGCYQGVAVASAVAGQIGEALLTQNYLAGL